MNDSPALVWFRRDLRLADNAALSYASARGTVIPVFIWSPEEDSPWQPGSASRWWLHKSLERLSEDLCRLGSRLIVRYGPAREALLDLAAETGSKAVYWNRLYEPAIVARDQGVKRALRERGLDAHSFPGNLLFEPWAIKNQAGDPFRVFTAFWKSCLKAPAPPVPITVPKQIPSPANWPVSLRVFDLDLDPGHGWTAGLCDAWVPGEAGAARRLGLFLENAGGAYATGRDRPDLQGTSRLSPHLHFGEISPRQVWHVAPCSTGDAYPRQLIWREFAQHLLFHFPQTPAVPLRPEFAAFPWRMDPSGLSAWTRGNTGYPLVDAGMRELWHTGWMHNRVRMVVGSFLVKHLLIPWQEGAAWFWDTLVDADLANNTLGWQWIAGCGADAAPYFRIFNPVIQGGKFDPNGAYVRRWVPELAANPIRGIHQPWKTPLVLHAAARERALRAFATTRRLARPEF